MSTYENCLFQGILIKQNFTKSQDGGQSGWRKRYPTSSNPVILTTQQRPKGQWKRGCKNPSLYTIAAVYSGLKWSIWGNTGHPFIPQVITFRLSMRPQFPIKCYVNVNSPHQVIRHYTWKIPPFLLFLIYLTFDLHCRLCGIMFRTKQDLELKSRNSGGPPFFDLRESIARILYGHIQDPKVRQEELHVVYFCWS